MSGGDVRAGGRVRGREHAKQLRPGAEVRGVAAADGGDAASADVALYCELLPSYAGERRACCVVAQTLIGASSGAMRLAHRALEMHAFEIGYRADAWVARAVDGTGDELCGTVADDEGLPVALDQARLATLALTRATASTAYEPMLVPGQLADALGHLLVIYLIAVEVASAQ